MLRYIFRRVLLMIPTLLAISVISFVIIQAPPGDFVDSYVAALRNRGQMVDPAYVESLRSAYGLGQPVFVQYFKWLGRLVQGDMGRSLQWHRPVSSLLAERLPWSVLVSLFAYVFIWLIGLPIGIISATHQYSVRDYLFTFLGFVGLATPGFLIALVLLYLNFVSTGNVNIGLLSPMFQQASWSLAKLWDLLRHLWIPALIVGLAGTAGMIRVMRANLLDELSKPYVMFARSKGLSERKLLYKYPFRIAINPVISTIGWTLPDLVNGELLVSMVLGLPTIAPIFLGALMNEDMFLAGSIVFVLSVLTVVGTLLSDILLAWVDPRIREAV